MNPTPLITHQASDFLGTDLPCWPSLEGRSQWVPATGSSITLAKKAEHYIRNFDHEKAKLALNTFRFNDREHWEQIQVDSSVPSLARAVCNLRHYYKQSAEQAVVLICRFFNPYCESKWSEEGIRLTWELVGNMVPTLGLLDEKAKAKKRSAELEDEVVDLIAYTRSGGRVRFNTLFALFKGWYPDLLVTPKAFGMAVSAITGLKSNASKGVRFYSGFHIPGSTECKNSVPAA